MKWTVEYFLTSSGRSPIAEFINSLNLRTRQKFYYVQALLENSGAALTMPFCKYIGEDIYELRFVGIEGQVRVLYFFISEQRIILTNGFVKKSQKTPLKEKELAINRRKLFLEGEKYDEN